MNLKHIWVLAAVLLIAQLFSACSAKYNLTTPIGDFSMTTEITDKYQDFTPQDGDQLLVVRLEPTTTGITQEQMEDYLFPSKDSNGAIAECEAGQYTLTSLQFEPGTNGQDCIIIFDVPKELTDNGAIRLQLPKEAQPVESDKK